MARIEDQAFSIDCPNPKCSREIDVRIRDAVSSRKARCSRCGAEMAIDSGAAGRLQRAAKDYQKAESTLLESQQRILEKVQIKLRS